MDWFGFDTDKLKRLKLYKEPTDIRYAFILVVTPTRVEYFNKIEQERFLTAAR